MAKNITDGINMSSVSPIEDQLSFSVTDIEEAFLRASLSVYDLEKALSSMKVSVEKLNKEQEYTPKEEKRTGDRSEKAPEGIAGKISESMDRFQQRLSDFTEKLSPGAFKDSVENGSLKLMLGMDELKDGISKHAVAINMGIIAIKTLDRTIARVFSEERELINKIAAGGTSNVGFDRLTDTMHAISLDLKHYNVAVSESTREMGRILAVRQEGMSSSFVAADELKSYMKGVPELMHKTGLEFSAVTTMSARLMEQFNIPLSETPKHINELNTYSRAANVGLDKYEGILNTVVASYRPYIKDIAAMPAILAPFADSINKGMYSVQMFAEANLGYAKETPEKLAFMAHEFATTTVDIDANLRKGAQAAVKLYTEGDFFGAQAKAREVMSADPTTTERALEAILLKFGNIKDDNSARVNEFLTYLRMTRGASGSVVEEAKRREDRDRARYFPPTDVGEKAAQRAGPTQQSFGKRVVTGISNLLSSVSRSLIVGTINNTVDDENLYSTQQVLNKQLRLSQPKFSGYGDPTIASSPGGLSGVVESQQGLIKSIDNLSNTLSEGKIKQPMSVKEEENLNTMYKFYLDSQAIDARVVKIVNQEITKGSR
jgi:hypothetical protein